MPTETDNPPASEVHGDIRRRILSGIPWVIALNLFTTPMSFVTNMILGRVSLTSPRSVGRSG